MMVATLILPLCLVFTCYMAGTEWITQLVSFPMLASVNQESFPNYHANIMKRIILPIVIPGLVTVILSLLSIWFAPVSIPKWSIWLLITLQIFPIISTACLQLPRHNQLTQNGFSLEVIQSLVTTQWLRTIPVTFATILLIWMVTFH